MQVNLKRNGWHSKLQEWTFGEQFNHTNLCPYFWFTVFCMMISPLVAIFKVCWWVYRGIRDFVMNYKRQELEIGSDEWNEYMRRRQEKSEKRQALMRKIAGIAKYPFFAVVGALVLAIVAGILFVIWENPMKLLTILGIIAGAAFACLALYGLFRFLQYIRIMPNLKSDKTSLVGRIGAGIQSVTMFFVTYMIAAKDKVCPMIEWVD